MRSAEDRLAGIGFGRRRREPECWSVVRLDRPDASVQPTRSCSPALLRWRLLLADDRRPSPYRITRIEE